MLLLGYSSVIGRKDPDAICDFVMADFGLSVVGQRIEALISRQEGLASLTKAERRVLELARLPNHEIMNRLGIEHDTLRTHLKHVYQKLGVTGRPALRAVLTTGSLMADAGAAQGGL